MLLPWVTRPAEGLFPSLTDLGQQGCRRGSFPDADAREANHGKQDIARPEARIEQLTLDLRAAQKCGYTRRSDSTGSNPAPELQSERRLPL